MIVAKFEKVSQKQYETDINNLLCFKNNSYNDIKLPFRATKGSAGYDFVLPFDIDIKPNEIKKIPTGIRAYIEDGYVLNIYPRSSLGFKYQMNLLNTTGIIDSDYYNADNEGHIIVGVINRGDKTLSLKKGDRFVQGIFLKYYLAEEEEVNTKRKGGFGSSNK